MSESEDDATRPLVLMIARSATNERRGTGRGAVIASGTSFLESGPPSRPPMTALREILACLHDRWIAGD